MTNPLLVPESPHLKYLFLLAGGKWWCFAPQDLATGSWEYLRASDMFLYSVC